MPQLQTFNIDLDGLIATEKTVENFVARCSGFMSKRKPPLIERRF